MSNYDCLLNMLNDVYGEIVLHKEECPGVYYITARKNEFDIFLHEYYVADKNTPSLSTQAKERGQPIEEVPGFLSFSIDDLYSGQKIVAYEIWRYRLRARLPIETSEDFYEFSLHAAEYHPDYFGTYPVPMLTPCGRVVRYQTVENGIYWLETEQAKETVAFCMPLWEMFSSYTQHLGKYVRGTTEDRTYLFFTHTDSCLPFFELWTEHPEWKDSPMFDLPALMNAIWAYFPDYAVSYNAMEQNGANSLSIILQNAELKVRPEKMISMTPEAGTDFLKI